MGGVDHDAGSELVFEKGIAGGFDGVRVKVRAIVAATEDEVAVGISGGGNGRGHSFRGDSEECLRLAGGFDGIDGCGDIA